MPLRDVAGDPYDALVLGLIVLGFLVAMEIRERWWMKR